MRCRKCEKLTMDRCTTDNRPRHKLTWSKAPGELTMICHMLNLPRVKQKLINIQKIPDMHELLFKCIYTINLSNCLPLLLTLHFLLLVSVSLICLSLVSILLVSHGTHSLLRRQSADEVPEKSRVQYKTSSVE